MAASYLYLLYARVRGVLGAGSCRWNRRLNATCEDSRPGIRHVSRKTRGSSWSQHARDEKALQERCQRPRQRPAAASGASPMGEADALVATSAAVSAAEPRECDALEARVQAHNDVEPWRERYNSLQCATSRVKRADIFAAFNLTLQAAKNRGGPGG